MPRKPQKITTRTPNRNNKTRKKTTSTILERKKRYTSLTNKKHKFTP